jgi:hypothetical protein
VLNSTAVNPVNLNATYSETYTWVDRNGDLQFQPGEQTGTPVVASAAQSSFDPNFSRPYTNEFTGGIDREVPGNLKVSAVFTYRAEKNQQGFLNTAAPFGTWPTRTQPDPGPDGRTGTADDSTVTYFDRVVGATQTVINNDPTLVQTYKGVEITATKRMSHRWQLLAGLTLSRSRQDNISENTTANNLVFGPNFIINDTGPITTDVPVQFKLSGTYILPYDISLAANFRSQSGTPYNRQVSVPMTLGGSATVNVEPYDSDRVPALTTLGLQASKSFVFSGSRGFTLYFTVDNVTNANTVWAVRNLTGLSSFRQGGDPSGALNTFPQFGTPTNIIGPRIARLGVSFRF